MSITVTLYAWWLLPYLAVGVVTYPVLAYLGWKHLAKFRGRPKFWERQRETAKPYGWKYPLWLALAVVAWPLAWWEELR